MMKLKKIAVLGGGSFGTVLANIAASNGFEVSLWVRDSEQALRINSEGANTTYHPELQLSSNIEASENLDEVIKNSSIVLIATPSSSPITSTRTAKGTKCAINITPPESIIAQANPAITFNNA